LFDLFITTNGPGEIATWVHPFVKRIRREFQEIRISLFIVPCRFKTGTEDAVARQIPEFDYVFSAGEFASKLMSLPFIPFQKGCGVFLGGDLGKAVLLKKRYKFPAIAYTEGGQSFKKSFDKFFTRDVDGDLMYSFFEDYQVDHNLVKELKKTKNIIFFPGSRPHQFKELFPLFQNVSKLLPSEYKSIFNVSPFIPDELIQKNKVDSRELNIYKNKSIELMMSAELCISIPGTNNIQLAYLNSPALVVFPFNNPELVDFPGLIGLIANLPGGKKLKKKWILNYLKKKGDYTSLVNRKENKEIFPELLGYLTAKQIANKIMEIVNDQKLLKSIRKNCSKLSKKSTVLDEMIEQVKGFYEQ
jgi:hypothetical protein